MPLNLTIWKINIFFLILYGEISVLIGPIRRLFVTDAFDTDTASYFPTNCHLINDNIPLSFKFSPIRTELSANHERDDKHMSRKVRHAKEP